MGQHGHGTALVPRRARQGERRFVCSSRRRIPVRTEWAAGDIAGGRTPSALSRRQSVLRQLNPAHMAQSRQEGDADPVDQYAPNLLARMLAVGLLMAAQGASIGAQARPLPPADTVVVNARIYTVDRQQPWAEALAIRDGKLVAVGSESSIEA